jgi:hypothetical protein
LLVPLAGTFSESDPDLFIDMGSTSIRLLGALMILLAFLTLVLAMVVGGDIVMVIFGLSLAASSMGLFRRAQASRDDED